MASATPIAVYVPAAGVSAPASKFTAERVNPPVTGKPPEKAEPRLLVHLEEPDKFEVTSVMITGITSVLFVPIRSRSGEVFGFYYLDNRVHKNGSFQEKDLKQVEAIVAGDHPERQFVALGAPLTVEADAGALLRRGAAPEPHVRSAECRERGQQLLGLEFVVTQRVGEGVLVVPGQVRPVLGEDEPVAP